jgi:eukaryotic-like serine/threonine-protein kinase
MASAVRPGDLLDHYRLDQLVSSTAMASVFRATDTRTGCAVAVKILNPRPRGIWRFSRDENNDLAREARLNRKLHHPGIVKMLPSEGSTQNYAVMEWIEGNLLRHVIDDRRNLTVRRAVLMACRICDVLNYIHAQGLVHLDLKSDNVIVDASDNVKLIDFGSARETRTTLLFIFTRRKGMGTPDYAAPEQIRGKSGDARSDIYALGVILYEMLTGEVPFSGVDSLTALNLRILVDPAPPSEINPEVAPELDNVVCRAMARHPSARYQTVRDLIGDLEYASERVPELRASKSSVPEPRVPELIGSR